MGESACLLRSFSHPSSASREAKEVGPSNFFLSMYHFFSCLMMFCSLKFFVLFSNILWVLLQLL